MVDIANFALNIKEELIHNLDYCQYVYIKEEWDIETKEAWRKFADFIEREVVEINASS